MPMKTLKMRSMGILPVPLALGIPGNSSCCTCKLMYTPLGAGGGRQPDVEMHAWSPYCQGQLTTQYIEYAVQAT